MNRNFVGVDVSKNILSCWFEGSCAEVPNSGRAFVRHLSRLSGATRVAIENTGSYHLAAAQAAFEAGYEVWVLNPRDCARYRSFSNPRAKTDRIDAEAIAHFAEHAHGRLRRFAPLPDRVRRIRGLLGRRDSVATARTMLEQSFSDSPEKEAAAGVLKEMRALEAELARRLEEAASESECAALLRQIPGVGPIVSSALAGVLEGGSFASADALVAYIGLDCRARDSGQMRGRRRISRQGDRLLRKLAFLAAMAAKRAPEWAAYYGRMLAKGLSKVQSIVAVARKLLRTAWSIWRHKSRYDPRRISCQHLTN